jgi:hypothetical protein
MNSIVFIDDAQITSSSGIERRIHQARKYAGNPVVTSDCDWEGAETILGTVRKEGERYRMWYQSYATSPSRNGFDSFIRSLHLYAESDDGLAWSKPELGITEDSAGSYANNIALVRPTFRKDINPSVLRTPHAPDGHDYTMFSYGVGYDLPYNGHFVAYSDDGLRWSDGPETPVIPGYDEDGWFMYDEVDETFRGLVSYGQGGGGPLSGTQLFSTQSTGGVEWSLPRPVLAPDKADTDWAGDDPNDKTLFPAMPITRYGPVLLGFLQVLRGHEIGGRGFDGEMEVQLVCSRDGKTWHRVGDRHPILERGDDESWDGGLVWMGHSLVEDGDEVIAYYTGCRRTAGALKRCKWTKSIGVASWPRDRLVGLAAREEGVIVTTATVAGRDLHVNADASKGKLTAELLDEDGSAMKGFAADEGKALANNDSLDHKLEWNNGALSLLAGRTVRIRLKLRDAEVFSLWWEQ